MSLTKQDVYDHVWAYFDLDDTDMPSSLMNRWVNEAWVKISRKTQTWPGFEDDAILPLVAGTQDYVMPFKAILSLEETVTYGLLTPIADESAAERLFPPPIATQRPFAWTSWNGNIRLYPIPDSDDYTIQVRGIRAPISPLPIAVTSVIDLPHDDAAELVMAWVLYRAAVRETELEQARHFLEGFEAGLRGLNQDEESGPASGIVLNSKRDYAALPDRLRYPFE